MKKLLALLVVLGLTPLAGADLIFTIDGEPQPDEITLYYCEKVTLGLHLAEGQNIQSYQITYSLNNEQAEFIFPDPDTSPQYGISFPWDSDAAGKVNAYDDEGIISWVEIAAANFFEADPGPLTLMDGLILHSLSGVPELTSTMSVVVSGDTVIDGETIPVDTVLHTMDIVPEPMTIALLGFGGAILSRFRRRR